MQKLLLVIVLVVSLVCGGTAWAVDNEPPLLISISVDKDVVSEGETLTLSMEAEDPETGIALAWISLDSPSYQQCWHCDGAQSISFNYTTFSPETNLLHTASKEIAYVGGIETGIWKISEVTLFDDAGNRHTYSVDISVEVKAKDSEPEPAYIRYIPYFSNANGSIVGIAIANSGTRSGNATITAFNNDGIIIATEEKELGLWQQAAFVPDIPADSSGWIEITADIPVEGLALLFDDTAMIDIDMKKSLSKSVFISQIAADGNDWNTYVMACNPGDTDTEVSLSYHFPGGGTSIDGSFTIPAKGATQVDLRDLLEIDLSGGTVLIHSVEPITAFVVYDGSLSGKNNWKAGLSAVPVY